jgi:hypothetical protein
MIHLDELRFDVSEQAILDRIERSLHAQGWAKHDTADGLLRDWRVLSVSVDRYRFTIDEYTDDLTGRDALEIVLSECDEPLRAKLLLSIDQADSEFLARTQRDTESVLARFFRIDESSGWWWKRIPAAGPLADYLNSSAASPV